MCVTGLIQSCHLTQSYVTWLIHMWHDSFICDMTNSYVTWTHSNVTWLIQSCDLTHSYVTWLNHMWHHEFIRHATYGVATISRLLKIIGLFCKRALSKNLYSAKETYDFQEPTNRSHPISKCDVRSSWKRFSGFIYVWLIRQWPGGSRRIDVWTKIMQDPYLHTLIHICIPIPIYSRLQEGRSEFTY